MTTRRWTAGLHRRVLANGLTALVQADPESPAAAVVTHVKAGFCDEPDRWQGISHVLEHMFFKGTPSRGVGRIASETRALGGYLNASTSYDATSYYVVLPAANLDRALAIQADALRHATLDAGELARELQVIIEEARRKLDTPSAVAAETLHEVLFDRHRIRRWRIGTEPMLAAFTREDVAGFYRSRYVPGRVIVSLAGVPDVEAAFAAVEAAFGDWPAAEGVVDRSPEEPWRRGVRARTLRGDVKRAEVVVGWRGLPPLHPDAAALDVAAVVLGSGRGSRLFQALRQPGVVTSVGAYHYSTSDVGVFAVSADLDPRRLDAAVAGIAAEVAALGREGPDPAELARARTLLTVQWARRLESVEGRAAAFAAAEAFAGCDVLEREYAALMAVDAAQVRDAVARWLTSDAVGAVAYLPPDAGSDLDGAGLAAAFAAPAPPAPRTAGAGPEPPGAPYVAVTRGVVEAGVEHLALPSVDLLVRRKPGVPLVSVGVYRRRRHEERKATAGLGALAVRAAARGAGGWSAAELAARFEGLGGALAPAVAADWFGFAAQVQSDRLEPAATLLRAVLAEPAFETAEVERERATLRDEVAQAADDMFRYPVQLALAAAFGDQRYGIPVKGWPESVDTLTPADVRQWHALELGAGRTTVVAVGDLDPAPALARLAAIFGGMPGGGLAEADRPGPVDTGPATLVETRAKSQTALAMVFPGPARHDARRHAAMVLSAVASGLGGRLFHALRDRRSLAYTVLMSSWQRRGAGGVLTYIATSPAREEEARSAMLEELALLGREPVTAEELAQAVNYLAGQAAVQRQTVSAVAAEILDAWLVGTGLAELHDPAAPFRAVTREQVLEVAAALDPAARAEGVVRGRAGEPVGEAAGVPG
jgi:zinc protease